jgi:hypothetical protein
MHSEIQVMKSKSHSLIWFGRTTKNMPESSIVNHQIRILD